MRTLHTGEFHGARRETQCHAGLTFADSEYAPGHELPYHAHDHAFFSLLLRGSFVERHELGTRTCLPTSVVFYPEHEPHTESFGGSGGRSFNIELGAAWSDRMRDFGLTYESGSREVRGSRLNWLATRLYGHFRRADEGVCCEEVVLEMLSEMGNGERLPEEPAAPSWLTRVRDLLHERYREVVRVSDLADEAGVHPVHLGRVFRRHLGCSIGEYVRRLRIEEACAALAATDRSLSAIALSMGFADQAHFTRRFKELTGMPPGHYRRVVSGN